MFDRWRGTIERVTNLYDADAARDIFDDLLTHYTCANRRYHDIRHIGFCLRQLDSVWGIAKQPDAIELAIWFHDVIYDSHRHDNEEQSALMADDAMSQLGVALPIAETVHSFILATRHNAPATDADAAMMIDIDLAILGQPAPVFDEYEAGVRFEYAWVPESTYRDGRSKILKAFLDRTRIYAVDHFYQSLESNARQNLARSLANFAK